MKDQIIDRIIRFDKLLGITALSIAFAAAFFSVYGIATLFAGAFTFAAFMASTLEVGKIVSVIFLYRYWKKTQGFLKTYLGIAVFVLMLITSLGIFGYLSAAYQKSAIEFKEAQEKIVVVESKKVYLNEKIEQSKARIKTLNDMRVMQESRMSEALTNAFLIRNPIQLKQIQEQTAELIKSADSDIRAENENIQQTMNEIVAINQQVTDMKFSAAGKKDIRTFQFVADQFGTTLDKVAKYFILIIIFVFDPLAISLILAYNVATYKRIEDKDNIPVPVIKSGEKSELSSKEPMKETIKPILDNKPEEIIKNPTEENQSKFKKIVNLIKSPEIVQEKKKSGLKTSDKKTHKYHDPYGKGPRQPWL